MSPLNLTWLVEDSVNDLGGFLGVFVFPCLMHWKGLIGAGSAATIASVLGLVVTWTMLPETRARAWRRSMPK